MNRQPLRHWLEHIQSLHHRTVDLTLERVAEVWRRMDSSLGGATVVSIAGTNGKGSAAAMLESVYRAAGYRVAVYTSPHLLRYNERVKVDGRAAADAELCDAFAFVERKRGAAPLTYFEFGTLAALHHFAARAPDVIILEVGLGGRRDAVNIIDADAALVTAIDVDHVDWLGADRESIAAEKAGILRPGRPAVAADVDAPAAIVERARAIGAPLWRAGHEFTVSAGDGGWRLRIDQGDGDPVVMDQLPPPGIPGAHQVDNAAGVLAVAHALGKVRPVAAEAARRGLSAATLPGRLQVKPGKPTVVLDVAHNAASAAALGKFVAALPCAKVRAVFAALADKPVREMARQVAASTWHVAATAGERGADAEWMRSEVAAAVAEAVTVDAYADIESAFDAAVAEAGDGECVVVFGSFLTVGAIMAHTANAG